MSLLIVHPGEGTLTTIATKQAVAGPPAWLDASRVALPTGTAAEPTSILVDTAGGKVSKGPAGERRLATSADGAVIATSAGAGAPVTLHSTKGWLTDERTSIGSVDVPEDFAEAVASPWIYRTAAGDRVAARRRDERILTSTTETMDGAASSSSRGSAVAWLRLARRPAADGPERQAGSLGGAVLHHIETWASSGSITPMTFCRVRRVEA